MNKVKFNMQAQMTHQNSNMKIEMAQQIQSSLGMRKKRKKKIMVEEIDEMSAGC